MRQKSERGDVFIGVAAVKTGEDIVQIELINSVMRPLKAANVRGQIQSDEPHAIDPALPLENRRRVHIRKWKPVPVTCVLPIPGRRPNLSQLHSILVIFICENERELPKIALAIVALSVGVQLHILVDLRGQDVLIRKVRATHSAHEVPSL